MFATSSTLLRTIGGFVIEASFLCLFDRTFSFWATQMHSILSQQYFRTFPQMAIVVVFCQCFQLRAILLTFVVNDLHYSFLLMTALVVMMEVVVRPQQNYLHLCSVDQVKSMFSDFFANLSTRYHRRHLHHNSTGCC